MRSPHIPYRLSESVLLFEISFSTERGECGQSCNKNQTGLGDQTTAAVSPVSTKRPARQYNRQNHFLEAIPPRAFMVCLPQFSALPIVTAPYTLWRTCKWIRCYSVHSLYRTNGCTPIQTELSSSFHCLRLREAVHVQRWSVEVVQWRHSDIWYDIDNVCFSGTTRED